MMPYNILIVENEPPIALSLHFAVENLGHRAVGIAKNMDQALALATNVDIAVIDVDLEDGKSGQAIGEMLAGYNIGILLMTSGSDPLDGLPGTFGIIRLPVTDLELSEVVQYVVDRRNGSQDVARPTCLS